MRIKRTWERIIKHFDLNKRAYKEPSDLIEFDLLNFNEDLEMAWTRVKALYDKILYKDSQWHLFYEGDFSTLRCSPKYARAVEKFLKKFDIEYKKNGVWFDGSSVVKRHQEIFKEMFHSFSELVMRLDEADLFAAADRVCHCFFNHAFYIAKDHRECFDGKGTDPLMWEAEMMARLSIYRAHYVGVLETSIEANKRLTALAKKKQEEEEE